MNTKMSKLALAIGALVMAGGAMAATDTAPITAEVIAPIAIAKATDLSFGNLAAGNGVVTVATDSARTKTGGTIGLVLTGSTPTAAKFNVTGQGDQTFSIVTGASTTTLTSEAGGSTPMAFTLITESIPGVGAAATVGKVTGTDATGTMLSGAATIYAGGALTVAADQTPGSYTGTVSVAVEYN